MKNDKKNVESKSEQRRHEASGAVKVTATRNAFLPDGKFVKKGESVLVDKNFVERMERENDKTFIKN